MRLSSVAKRNGFTLIELLVVIAIIAILMALTVGVMSKVFVYLDEVKVVTEVNRLSESCNLFKSTFGRYPPAKIILCENGSNYATLIGGGGTVGELAAYSVEYLSNIFPGIVFPGNVFDWNGDGSINGLPINGLSSGWVLEGQESLVYFLGGMRINGVHIGFNTDKTKPTTIPTATTSGARLGPFFQFEADRLKTTTNLASGTSFPVYFDVYGAKPYAYFVARYPGTSNYFHPGAQQLGTYNIASQQFLSDCYSLTGNFVPFVKAQIGAGMSYHKGDTFQIVSAGKDKQFGCGGQWDQTNPENSNFGYMTNANFIPTPATPAEKEATYDDISNVSNGRVVPK